MVNEPDVPVLESAPSSHTDLQRLREALYGDQLRTTERRLSDLESRLDSAHREWMEASLAEIRAVGADLAEQLEKVDARLRALRRDLRAMAGQQSTDDLDARLRDQQTAIDRRLKRLAADLAAQLRRVDRRQRKRLDRIKQSHDDRTAALQHRARASRSLIERGQWAKAIEAWKRVGGKPELAREFVRFFRLAFEWLPEQTLQAAWFGVHDDRVSLTVGNIVLAAIHASPKSAWLLVDEAWNRPAKLTQKYTALGWKVFTWKRLEPGVRSASVWASYAAAAGKVWDAPVARVEIGRNLTNKRRVVDLLGLA